MIESNNMADKIKTAYHICFDQSSTVIKCNRLHFDTDFLIELRSTLAVIIKNLYLQIKILSKFGLKYV